MINFTKIGEKIYAQNGKKIIDTIIVESYRDENGMPKHRVLINFGLVDEESVPFLKAAFAKKKPRLVYDEE